MRRYLQANTKSGLRYLKRFQNHIEDIFTRKYSKYDLYNDKEKLHKATDHILKMYERYELDENDAILAMMESLQRALA